MVPDRLLNLRLSRPLIRRWDTSDLIEGTQRDEHHQAKDDHKEPESVVELLGLERSISVWVCKYLNDVFMNIYTSWSL